MMARVANPIIFICASIRVPDLAGAASASAFCRRYGVEAAKKG